MYTQNNEFILNILLEWVNLKQIAMQTLLAASGAEKCALKHTKCPKESLGGSIKVSQK